MSLLVVNLLFLSLLAPTRFAIKISKNENKYALFKKMGDKDSNLLW